MKTSSITWRISSCSSSSSVHDRPVLNPVELAVPVVGRLVDEADDLVAVGPIGAEVSVNALGEAPGPDDEGSPHVTVPRPIHRSPAGSHQQTEGERGQPEMRHIAEAQAPADAGQREHRRQCRS